LGGFYILNVAVSLVRNNGFYEDVGTLRSFPQRLLICKMQHGGEICQLELLRQYVLKIGDRPEQIHCLASETGSFGKGRLEQSLSLTS
jgi:hypothetical protein